MKCPYCASADTKVMDKRDSENGGATRRRRECLKCSKRFTTYERVDDKNIILVKKDGRREKFSKEKLRNGIMKACEKRPISVEKVDKIISEIEEKLGKKGKEVKSEVLGKMVMNKLKKR